MRPATPGVLRAPRHPPRGRTAAGTRRRAAAPRRRSQLSRVGTLFDGAPRRDRPGDLDRQPALHRSSASCRAPSGSRIGDRRSGRCSIRGRCRPMKRWRWSSAGRRRLTGAPRRAAAGRFGGVRAAAARGTARAAAAGVGHRGHADRAADGAVPSYLLGSSVLLTLLIACANVAILMIAQWTAREHEIAIRASIGATRARIIRALLTESVFVACVGGVLGLGATLGLRAWVVARAGAATGASSTSRSTR